jgi:hypothetical protein
LKRAAQKEEPEGVRPLTLDLPSAKLLEAFVLLGNHLQVLLEGIQLRG